MPVILHKTKTVGLVSSAAPAFESLINMSNAEFSAMAAEGRKALKDQIDRHTTAAMLGITIRTLLRWHHQNFGPKRLVLSAGRYGYGRAEVEAWVAEHGQGSHRPRSLSKPLD
jgi:predicted DNA-binding transcriptional regulator AlpA